MSEQRHRIEVWALQDEGDMLRVEAWVDEDGHVGIYQGGELFDCPYDTPEEATRLLGKRFFAKAEHLDGHSYYSEPFDMVQWLSEHWEEKDEEE